MKPKQTQIDEAIAWIRREITAGTFDADETYNRMTAYHGLDHDSSSAAAWNEATEFLIANGDLLIN